MKTSKIFKSIIIILFIIINIQINITNVLARAGGGHSGGGHSGGYHSGGYHSSSGSDFVGDLIVCGMLIIIVLVIKLLSIPSNHRHKQRKRRIRDLNILLVEKAKEVKESLLKLAELDKKYEINNLRDRIKEVYFNVQDAWNINTLDDIHSCATYNMVNYLKRQRKKSAGLIKRNKPLGITDIELHDIRFLCIDTNKILVVITGSMVDDNWSRHMKNLNKPIPRFDELWKFVFTEGSWKLDSIGQMGDKGYLEEFGYIYNKKKGYIYKK